MQHYKPKRSYTILKVFKIFFTLEEIHLLLIFNLQFPITFLLFKSPLTFKLLFYLCKQKAFGLF